MKHDPSNPKDKIGATKAPLSLFPVTAIKEGAMALFLGKTKYGRSNWRATPVRADIYFEALLRHAYRWWEGNDIDPEDGTPELGNCLACIAILIDAKVSGTLIDNRQFNGANAAAHISRDLGVMAELEVKYADKKPKHYTIADNVTTVADFRINKGTANDPAVIVLESGQVLARFIPDGAIRK